MSIVYLLPTIFWMWMIWECVRYDPERYTWIWLLILLNFPGAVIYFFARRLPALNLPTSKRWQRRLRRDELWNAEAAAQNIGNAYQFVNLGKLRQELGLFEEAKDSYLNALEKEPNNLQALWGIVEIDNKNENFSEVKENLEKILSIKPDYEYGNASLIYIKTLIKLKEQEDIKNLLEENIKIWNKPEAYLLLAEIQIEEAKTELAKDNLKKMLLNIRSAPKFHYKRHQHLERKAKKMLNKL